MMAYIAPFLVIFSIMCLTAPDGVSSIWLQKEQIVSILHSEDCAKGSHVKVTMSNGTFACVRETPQEIIKKLEEQK